MSHLCSPKVTQAKNSACRRAREKSHIIHAVGVPVGFASPLRGLARSQFAPKVIHLGRDAHSLPACRAPNSTEQVTLQPWWAASQAMLVQGSGSILGANPDKFSIAPKTLAVFESSLSCNSPLTRLSSTAPPASVLLDGSTGVLPALA